MNTSLSNRTMLSLCILGTFLVYRISGAQTAWENMLPCEFREELYPCYTTCTAKPDKRACAQFGNRDAISASILCKGAEWSRVHGRRWYATCTSVKGAISSEVQLGKIVESLSSVYLYVQLCTYNVPLYCQYTTWCIPCFSVNTKPHCTLHSPLLLLHRDPEISVILCRAAPN